MTENYLSHHGILGMKWGIRRYQNKDGSLTDAGKKKDITSLSMLKNLLLISYRILILILLKNQLIFQKLNPEVILMLKMHTSARD